MSVSYHAYFPFGEEITPTTQDVERKKFTGHERDFGNPSGVADDLDYMHARHYNPLLGRFLTTDPVLQVGPAQVLPQYWNRYSYSFNNPLKYVDPSGAIAKAGDQVQGTGMFGCIYAQFKSWLDQWAPPQEASSTDPNVRALLEEYGEAKEHPQSLLGWSCPVIVDT
jgi:RHS repeat-associated protein